MQHAKIIFILVYLVIMGISVSKAQTMVKDMDGNTYRTVKIGTQVWMAENLKTTHYRNGDSISTVDPAITWSDTTASYCDYNNDSKLAKIYGHLYNGYSVRDKRNIAPLGWHVPTEADWNILAIFLGGKDVAGGKLKERGTDHWINPNTGATNLTGFTALPGGFRQDLVYASMGEDGGYWSSTEPFVTLMKCCYMINASLILDFIIADEKRFYSVRCVKD